MKASRWFLLAGLVFVAFAVVMLVVKGPGVAVGVPLCIGMFLSAASGMAERDEVVAALRQEVNELRREVRALRG